MTLVTDCCSLAPPPWKLLPFPAERVCPHTAPGNSRPILSPGWTTVLKSIQPACQSFSQPASQSVFVSFPWLQRRAPGWTAWPLTRRTRSASRWWRARSAGQEVLCPSRVGSWWATAAWSSSADDGPSPRSSSFSMTSWFMGASLSTAAGTRNRK